MIQIGNNKDAIFESIYEYCQRYQIPLENLIDILEDQKVLPMIRGKANEFLATALLKRTLSRNWQVNKLNINAQPNSSDEDIRITHSKTGAQIKVEAKSAVRGDFRVGTSRTKIKEPHFAVKCHRSRSNIKKHKTTNDRYLVEDFDLLLCNVSNSIFRSKTYGDAMELIQDPDSVKFLQEYYGEADAVSLVRAAYNDWRFCFPADISEDGTTIPRTPKVLMTNDPNWFSISELENRLTNYLNRVLLKAGG